MQFLTLWLTLCVITGVIGDLYYKHDGSVYGPFPTAQMLDWLNAGYFAPDLLVSPDSYFSQSYSIADYFNTPMPSGNSMNSIDAPGSAFDNDYHLSEQADDWLDDDNAQPTMYRNYLNKIASKIPYSYQQKASDIANKVTDKVSDSFGRVSERASWLANVAAERLSMFRSSQEGDNTQQQGGQEAYQGQVGYDQYGQPIYNQQQQAYDPYNQQQGYQQGQYDPYNQQQQPHDHYQQQQGYLGQQGHQYDPYQQQEHNPYQQQQHNPYQQQEHNPYQQQQDPYAIEQNTVDPSLEYYHPTAEAEAPAVAFMDMSVSDVVDEAVVPHTETVDVSDSSGSIFGRFPTASRPLGRTEAPQQLSPGNTEESLVEASDSIDVEEMPVNVFPMPPQVSLDSSPPVTFDTDAPTLDNPSITIAREVLEEIEQSDMHEHQDYEQQFSPWEHVANSEWRKDQDVTDHLESFYGHANEMLAAEVNEPSPEQSREQQSGDAMNSLKPSSAMLQPQQQPMQGMEQHSSPSAAYPSNDDPCLHQPHHYDQQQAYDSPDMYMDVDEYPTGGGYKEEYDWTSELMSSQPHESHVQKKWKQVLSKIGSGLKKIIVPSMPFSWPFGKKQEREDDWLADLTKDEQPPASKGSSLIAILQDMSRKQLTGVSFWFANKVMVLLAAYWATQTYMPSGSQHAKVYCLFSVAVLSVQYVLLCFYGIASMKHLSSQSNVASDLYEPAEDNSNILSLLVHLAYLREFLAMSQGKNWAIIPHVQQLLSAEQRKAVQLLEEHEYQNSYNSGSSGMTKDDSVTIQASSSRLSMLPQLLWQCVSFGLLSYLMVETAVSRVRELSDESIWNFQIPIPVPVDENIEVTTATATTTTTAAAAARTGWLSSAMQFLCSRLGVSQEWETMVKFLSYAMGRVWSAPISSDVSDEQSLKYVLNALGSAILVLMPLFLALSFYWQFNDTQRAQQRLRDVVDASRKENEEESVDSLSFRVKISYNGVNSAGKIPVSKVRSFL